MTNETDGRRPHPVWVCEQCNYWAPRLSEDAPECPYCSHPSYEPYRPVYMDESMRLPPRKEDINE